jgi:sarcosine oxidase, subunit gamma
MADRLARAAVLAEAVGVANPRLEGAGVTVEAAPITAQIVVRATPEELPAREAALGFPLPVEPNRIAGKDAATVAVWLAPDRWLVVAEGEPAAALLVRLGDGAYDVTDGLAAIDIAGLGSRDLLAGACGLDLHSRAFPAGMAAQTHTAHVDVLLYRRPGDDAFRLHVDRSVARHLWAWLEELASTSKALER